MSEHLHLDPDSLSAFLEGVLPEHEREACLEHLAGCERCREVVFLARESQPAPAVAVPWWRRWLAPVPVLSAAAAVGLIVLGVWIYMRPPGTELVVVAPNPPEPPIVAPVLPKVLPAPPVAVARKPAQIRRPFQAPPVERLQSSVVPEPPNVGVEVALNPPAVPPPAPPSALPAPRPSVKVEVDAGATIAGTVADATGAGIPGATVSYRQIGGTHSGSVRTGPAGDYKLAGLPPGRYELRIESMGFRMDSRRIDVGPAEMARVSSALQVGSVTETVEVTASGPSVAVAGPRPLPSKLPTGITVTSGKTMLSVDSKGALFVSTNGGRRWKEVQPVWQGRIDDLEAIARQADGAVFRLTTESGAAWLSRDGVRWYAAPK